MFIVKPGGVRSAHVATRAASGNAQYVESFSTIGNCEA
jgi:hypothetical protein